MPKLPDLSKGHLYELQRTRGEVADTSGNLKRGVDSMATAMEEGSRAIMKFHDQERDRRDAIEALDAENKARDLLRAQEQALERNPDFDNHEKMFNEGTTTGMKAILSGITNPKIKDKLANRFWEKHQSAQEGVRKKAERGRNSVMAATAEQKIADSLKDIENGDLPPEQIAARVRDTKANIDHLLSINAIDAQQHRRMMQDYINKYGTAAIDAMAVNEDPDVVAGTVEKYRKSRKSFPGYLGVDKTVPDVKVAPKVPVLKRTVGAPRKSQIKGIAIHQTWGSDTMDGNGSWSNKTNTGANYYIDKDGQVYAWAPDDVRMNHIGQGRNGKRQDLTNDSAIGIEIMTRPNERPNAKQIAAARSLSLSLASKYGFDPMTDVVGHGEITQATHRRPDEAIEVVRAIREGKMSVGANPETGEEPVPVAKRGLTQYAGLKKDTQTDAAPTPQEAIDPKLWNMHQLLSGMSDVELADMERRLKARAKAQRGDQEITDKANLEGIVDRIRQTGEVSPQDQEIIDRVKGSNKKLYATFDLAREEAVYFAEGQQKIVPDENEPDGRRAIPLEAMRPEELQDHLEKLKELATRKNISGREVAARTNAIGDIVKKVKAIEDLRENDPGASVNKDPAVMEAEDRLDRFGISLVAGEGPDQAGERVPSVTGFAPQDEAWKKGATPGAPIQRPEALALEQKQAYAKALFEARLEAQLKVGIAPEKASYVTKSQARQLLWHEKGTGTEQEFRDKLEKAYQTALGWVGDPEMAGKIVADAYNVQVKGERAERKEIVQEYEDKDPGLTPAQRRKMLDVDRKAALIDFEGIDKKELPKNLPSSAAVEWLKANINDPQAVASFNTKFGAEALAKALTFVPGGDIKPMEGVDRWGNPVKESGSWLPWK